MFIHGFIPGSVIGMILLFLCLFFKVIQPDAVKSTATVITKNMAVFFVPAAVGLMAYIEILSQNILAIVLGIGLSTVFTIVTVAAVQQYFESRRKSSDK